MMQTVGAWSRSFRALPALLLGMALLAGCGGGAAPGRGAASDAPAAPAAPAAWPLAPRPTSAPDAAPALDAVRATSTAVMAALAPRDAAAPTLVGDWQVAVVHAWVADLPPGSGGAGGRRIVLVDLAAVNTRVDRSLTWDWLKRPQTLTLLAPDRRYLDLAPDGGAAVQAHPLLRAAVAAACPADGAAALSAIGAALTGATERGVTVPPRMPVRALTAFTLPADAAAPDGWMLQLRLPDGSARVRVALRLTPLAGTALDAARASPTTAGTAAASPTTAGTAAASPTTAGTAAASPTTAGTAAASPTATGTAAASPTATGDGIMGAAWDATGAPPLVLQALDRAVARSAVWRDWEITRATAAPGGAAAWSRLRQCGATVAVTLDVTNRQTKSRPWLRAAWVADAAGRYVAATGEPITLDPGIPERITLTAPWPPLLGPPAAVILADGADATAISIVPPDAVEAPAYPPTATPTATPTGTPVTPTPMTGAD